jgi:hypothetical protein
LKLGIWNVEDPGGLADQMSWQQLERWMAVFSLQPWGDEWLRSAVLMSQQYNVNRPRGKPPLSPFDFMPVEKRAQTQGEMLAILKKVPQ